MLAAYIAGHVLQAFASYIDHHFLHTPSTQTFKVVFADEGDEKHGAFQENLRAGLIAQFKSDRENEYFKLCEAYIRNRHLDGYTEVFLANRDLFRGLTISMLPSCLIFLWLWKLDWKNRVHAFFCIALGISTVVCYLRFERFNEYWSQSVYRAWYVDYTIPSHDAAPAAVAPLAK